jgi:hypothetical protein
VSRYTPIFSGIVESSLWDEEDAVVKVFLTMLALMDGDFVVRKDEYRLAFYSRKKEEEVRHALRVLAAPDKKRPGQEHEGRRIRKVDDGWAVLNGEKYQKAMLEANRRSYMRKYMADRRAGKTKMDGGVGPPAGMAGHERLERAGASQEELDRHEATVLGEIEDNRKEQQALQEGLEG